MRKYEKNFISDDGKLIRIEVELKYTKIDKEESQKPQFKHRVKGFVNDEFIDCMDCNNATMGNTIDKMEEICKAKTPRVRSYIDAQVKKLMKLGFK